MSEEHRRILAFERELMRRTTQRAERFAWGTAYLDDRFPLRWDSNLLWVDATLDGVEAADLAAEADRVLGGLGLTHRNVLLDDESAAERLAPGLVKLGYARDRLATMIHRRPPDRPSQVRVEEVDVDAFVPIVEDAIRPEPYATSEEVVRQLADHRRVLAEAGARFFVALDDGVPAARCELYPAEGIAQVEDVGTLEAHRGRGLARAVVLRVVEEARAAGCDLVFLYADDRDWPKHLYAKLGFDAATRWSAFARPGTS